MYSVSNNIPVNYTAANVGVINPPDKLYRWGGLSDSEMEKSFRKMDNSINKKQKHISFEDRKNTPFLIKIGIAALGVVALLKSGKFLFKK